MGANSEVHNQGTLPLMYVEIETSIKAIMICPKKKNMDVITTVIIICVSIAKTASFIRG